MFPDVQSDCTTLKRSFALYNPSLACMHQIVDWNFKDGYAFDCQGELS